jgi:hypothetical protein
MSSFVRCSKKLLAKTTSIVASSTPDRSVVEEAIVRMPGAAFAARSGLRSTAILSAATMLLRNSQ